MAESPSGQVLRSIALFPLNVVLFPGMRLPLHIFEERYRLMIRRCLDEGLEFGVCLIQAGPEVGGPATPYQVGTLTHLRDVARLPDGRFNLLTEGTSRFRLLELTAEEPYLQAIVELLPEVSPASENLAPVV
ncbi:MAG TPA: LON peptidase substrate-binding domain-containing protein, partial [Dehalococcoidia bacterium]|nr:LON peptidase substrate-binding domain-containing protein [Dehalococcoidia bacterium]